MAGLVMCTLAAAAKGRLLWAMLMAGHPWLLQPHAGGGVQLPYPASTGWAFLTPGTCDVWLRGHAAPCVVWCSAADKWSEGGGLGGGQPRPARVRAASANLWLCLWVRGCMYQHFCSTVCVGGWLTGATTHLALCRCPSRLRVLAGVPGERACTLPAPSLLRT